MRRAYADTAPDIEIAEGEGNMMKQMTPGEHVLFLRWGMETGVDDEVGVGMAVRRGWMLSLRWLLGRVLPLAAIIKASLHFRGGGP